MYIHKIQIIYFYDAADIPFKEYFINIHAASVRWKIQGIFWDITLTLFCTQLQMGFIRYRSDSLLFFYKLF